MLGTLTITVGQREPATVSPQEEAAESLENMPHEEPAPVGVEQKDDQETIEEKPISEEKLNQVEQSSDAQSNEVGFKKVFKFVGFKFTVKKDKTEKSDPVQLLTVKKEEVVVNGTEKKEDNSETTEEKPETLDQATSGLREADKPNKEADLPVEKDVEETPALETPPEKAEQNGIQVESQDGVEEKDTKKSPESPTNPLVSETSSPLKKFFTQGWAGLRKKASFKKPKEDEQLAADKTAKEVQEVEASGTPVEASEEKKPSEDQVPESTTAIEESGISPSENPEASIVETVQAKEPCAPLAEMETSPKSEEPPTNQIIELTGKAPDKDDQPLEESPVSESVVSAPETQLEGLVATQSNEEVAKVEAEVVAVAEKIQDDAAEVQHLPAVSNSEKPVDIEVHAMKPADDEVTPTEEAGTMPDAETCPPEASAQKPSEGIVNEAELLSSQEKAKLQGSPLRKLFAGSSLKKISGKKAKVKKEDDSKPEEREAKLEETTEQLQPPSEQPEAAEVEKGDSGASSPEEAVDASSLVPVPEAAQVSEGEGEGATSDGERKKDGITPWASFKKLVTPKKRVKKLSDSDKEDEPEKAGKSATMSSTDSANSDNHEEAKPDESKTNEEEPKLEKSAEETKRKVDNSVSWEALICVGSSKKRARKTSDSDEEESQKPLEENQKAEEEQADKSAETETEAPLATSQESDPGQGSPSPEQAGSPSEAEGEGVSTWASFKRLVTPRRKSKTRMEEKAEESTTVNEHPEEEPGKDESWVSFKKLIPGRRKKKSDGKMEPATVEEGQETVEDEDDVPAVVPLSEYEAAEQEKLEAQQAMATKAIHEGIAPQASAVEGETLQTGEPCEGLVHAVTVTVVEGERAVTTMEERSPSWISATVTESIQQESGCKEVLQTKEVLETEVVVEQAVVVNTFALVSSEVSDRTTANEITSEAVTALEETTEGSFAEETTEMVSAVSQLSESQVTTEESTPVPEAESEEKSLEEQKKQTQEVLEEAAQKVRLAEVLKATSPMTMEAITCSSQTNESEVKEDLEAIVVRIQESVCDQTSLEKIVPKESGLQDVVEISDVLEVEETVTKKVSQVSVETCFAMQENIEVIQSYVVDHETVEKPEEVDEKVLKEETEIHSIVTVSVEAEPELEVDERIVPQRQYMQCATLEAKLSDQLVEWDCVPVADSERVAALLEEKVLEVVQKSLNGLECTQSSTTKEVTQIPQETEPVKLEDSKVCMAEATEHSQAHVGFQQKEQLEQNDLVETEDREEAMLQTEPGVSETELSQKNEMSDKCQFVESDAEKMEAFVCFEESKITKAGGFQTLTAEEESVSLQQAADCGVKVNQDLFEVIEGSEKRDEQSAHVNPVQEVLQVQIVTNIPDVEAFEAQIESLPITAAAIEEQVVAETVDLVEASAETQEPINVRVAEDGAPALGDEPFKESESLTAAAIMDAAVEAVTSSIASVALEKCVQSDSQEITVNKIVSQEICKTTLENENHEVIQSLAFDSLSSIPVQDIHTDVQPCQDQAMDNLSPDLPSDADTAEVPAIVCEVQESDLCSDVKHLAPTSGTPEPIDQINIVAETHVLESTVEQPEYEIADSEMTKVLLEPIVQSENEQVTAAVEGVESVLQMCEPVCPQILPSSQKQDMSVEFQHTKPGHAVSFEYHSSETVQELNLKTTKTAETELECMEGSDADEVTADAIHSVVALAQNPDACVAGVQEKTQQPAEPSNIPDAEIEGGEHGCTVSIESHSSIIVEKIIQTAVEEVGCVEGGLQKSALGQFEAETQEGLEESSVAEVQRDLPVKERVVLTEIVQCSDVSRTVIFESHSSSIVETITESTAKEVERVEFVHDASEERFMAESDVTEKETEPPTEHSEVICTESIASHSSTIMEPITQTCVEEAVHAALSEETAMVETGESPEGECVQLQETVATDHQLIDNARSDVQYLVTAPNPEDVGLPVLQEVAKTDDQQVPNVASKVPCQLETSQNANQSADCDFRDQEEAEQQSSVKMVVVEDPEEQPCSIEETVLQHITERLSDVCKEELNSVCIHRENENAESVSEQECIKQFSEKAMPELSDQCNVGASAMEEKAAEEDFTLLGVENGQQPPELETQTQALENEGSVDQASATESEVLATESAVLASLVQERLEAPEQFKDTETAQTVEIQEHHNVQCVQVDKLDVVPSQPDDELQSRGQEAVCSPLDAPHELPQAKSASEES
ncbi:A-kinase anchor protein 12 isoform X2 [Ambystoma mexicanum]|uniref:A-kinase anchor protein 12 isoform X2 n=1 Tax=Ambystoma mexicanum TaxID=8296 RepID=UPI0037E7AC3E